MNKAFLWAGTALMMGPAYAHAPNPVSTVPSAAKLMAAAERASAISKKPILVVFGASWCPWCTRLHAFADTPEMAPVFAKNYVIVHMDVMENDKKSLETPGGTKLKDAISGTLASHKHEGLPYFAALDSRGKKLADSNLPGTNDSIGFPQAAGELTAFNTFFKPRLLKWPTRSAPRSPQR